MELVGRVMGFRQHPITAPVDQIVGEAGREPHRGEDEERGDAKEPLYPFPVKGV